MRRIAHKYTVYGKLKYSSTSLTHFENILQCEVFFSSKHVVTIVYFVKSLQRLNGKLISIAFQDWVVKS